MLSIINKLKKQKQMSNYYNTEDVGDFPWKEFILMVIFMIILPSLFLILMKP
jgi:hypothetical protein